MICKICQKELHNKGISSHLRHKHKITSEEYYIKYIGNVNCNSCKNKECTNKSHFKGIFEGFFEYCSGKCAKNAIENKNTS